MNVQLLESGILLFILTPAISGMLQGECMLLDLKQGLKKEIPPTKSLLKEKRKNSRLESEGVKVSTVSFHSFLFQLNF